MTSTPQSRAASSVRVAPLLTPDLVHYPYVAITHFPNYYLDQPEQGMLVARVVSTNDQTLVLEVINGAYRMTIGADGIGTCADDRAGPPVRRFYLQWQGPKPDRTRRESEVYDALLDVAHADIRAGRYAPTLSADLGELRVADLVERFKAQGDMRLERYLVSAYPKLVEIERAEAEIAELEAEIADSEAG